MRLFGKNFMTGYRTIAAALVVVAVEISRLFSYQISEDDARFVIETLVAICSGCAAVYFRLKATVKHGAAE